MTNILYETERTNEHDVKKLEHRNFKRLYTPKLRVNIKVTDIRKGKPTPPDNEDIEQ